MNIKITNDGSETDIEEIYRELKQYNLSKREPSNNVPLGIFIEDNDGKKTAGLIGETFGNWLCIKYLWVNEKLRGNGIGKKLIDAAEAEAKNRGCKYSFVDTFDFQAPDFYRKLGYNDVLALKEYPYTGARYYFTKELN